jgi:hypothetical protein
MNPSSPSSGVARSRFEFHAGVDLSARHAFVPGSNMGSWSGLGEPSEPVGKLAPAKPAFDVKKGTPGGPDPTGRRLQSWTDLANTGRERPFNRPIR